MLGTESHRSELERVVFVEVVDGVVILRRHLFGACLSLTVIIRLVLRVIRGVLNVLVRVSVTAFALVIVVIVDRLLVLLLTFLRYVVLILVYVNFSQRCGNELVSCELSEPLTP